MIAEPWGPGPLGLAGRKRWLEAISQTSQGALDVDSDWPPLTIRDGHDLRPLASLGLAHGGASALGWREAPVDECFLQIQIAFVVKRLRQNFEDAPQQSGAHPVLESPVTGLIRGIAIRQIRPWGAGPQDPEDAVEYSTVLFPRAPSAVVPPGELGQEGTDEGPLLVGQVAGMRRCEVGLPPS